MDNNNTSSSHRKKFLIVRDDQIFPGKNGFEFRRSTVYRFYRDAFPDFEVSLSSPFNKDLLTEEAQCIDGMRVLPRPGYENTKNFYQKMPLHMFRQIKYLRRHIRGSDIVALVMPCCTAPIIYGVARAMKKPVLIYVVGDVQKVVAEGKYNNSILRKLAIIMSGWELWFTRWVAARNPSFVLGEEMRVKLRAVAPHAAPAMNSLVSAKDIVEPRRTTLEEQITIFTACRLVFEKGLETAIEAVSILRKDAMDIQFLIAGDGPERSKLEYFAKSKGLQDYVRFVGWIDGNELQRHYRSSDIFLLPAIAGEGIPKAILDAMAADLPIISTRDGGIPDLLGDNQERGWMVPHSNPAKLVSAIRECITDDNLRIRKLQKAHEYIRQHTTEIEGERVQKKLREMLNMPNA